MQKSQKSPFSKKVETPQIHLAKPLTGPQCSWQNVARCNQMLLQQNSSAAKGFGSLQSALSLKAWIILSERWSPSIPRTPPAVLAAKHCQMKAIPCCFLGTRTLNYQREEEGATEGAQCLITIYNYLRCFWTKFAHQLTRYVKWAIPLNLNEVCCSLQYDNGLLSTFEPSFMHSPPSYELPLSD